MGVAAVASNGTPEFITVNARDDDDFTQQLYSVAERIVAGTFVIVTGPVSIALARDALDAISSLDAMVLWLAPLSDTEILLGMPELNDDELLEQAYAAIETAYPDLLDSRINVAVAPIVEVITLANRNPN